MNGKLCKRIRLAALRSNLPETYGMPATVQELKREYRAEPYHKRRLPRIRVHGHSERLRVHYDWVQRHRAGAA